MSLLEEQIDAITFQIRGAAITLHRRIGPGCFERAYAPCFAYELHKRCARRPESDPVRRSESDPV
jgi:hypothetical protein